MGTGRDARPLAARLARALARAGSTAMFGLPGGGPNLDLVGAAAREGIRFHLAHGETSAAIMAATHGLLTGTPTAVVVTRGPGATSAANGTAQATLDRYPLLTVTDTVPQAQRARVAHQRLDQRALFAPIAKRSLSITDATPDAELRDAIAEAHRWPYGAIHLDDDAGGPPAGVDPSSHGAATPPDEIDVARRPPVSGDEVERAAALIAAARRPLVIAGMEAAVLGAPIRDLLERFGAPVLTTYQAIGLVDTEGPLHAGLFTNGELERPVLDEADLVVTVGLDLVEPIPAPWTCAHPVVRIAALPQTDDYLPATVDLVGDVVALTAQVLRGSHGWPDGRAAELRRAARRRIRCCEDGGDAFGPVALVDAVLGARPPDATVTVDAGAHFLAVMPLAPVARPFDLLISNGLATMGFAVPAAIGAAIARPGRPVVAFVGDGGLGMGLAELETIARLRLPVTVVVFDDAALSLIEIKQRDTHGGPEVVRYREVDFAAIGRACGLDGHVATSAAEVGALLRDGWERPRLVDARIDPTSYRRLIGVTRG